jgi:predicted ABC-type ATPase
VLSDPFGEQVETLAPYVESGYTVAILFIRLDSARESIRRVAIRTSQGGHDVPDEKLKARFKRTKANLQRAIESLPHVVVYDNSNLEQPYRLVEVYENGQQVDV